MRRRLLIVAVVAAFTALAFAGTAYALKLFIGKTQVSATATFEPSTLPAKGNAPVDVTSTIKVSNNDGSPPPQLTKITLQFDKHGTIDARGLPVCTMGRLEEKTSKQARAACPNAIVGEGIGRAIVTLPGMSPVSISSPLIFFNAPPQNGMPTLIAHAYETVPAPKALLTPIPVERVHAGRYGYRAQVELPEIAGGYGAATLSEATIGRTWKRGGKTVGYTNAHCAGSRLQVYGTMGFAEGGFLNGTVVQSCRTAG